VKFVKNTEDVKKTTYRDTIANRRNILPSIQIDGDGDGTIARGNRFYAPKWL
jgi:hypothetical protein